MDNQVENPQDNTQYSLLYENDCENPFYKCKIDKLEYETDEEESDKSIRIVYFWNFEFNYEYYNLTYFNIFISKTDDFKLRLNELKSIRNNSSNINGQIIKLDNNQLKINDKVNLYLIAYYDNAKTNIDFYGIFNQPICEEKLLENIKKESTYGKNGIVSNTSINLGSNDFIIIHKNIEIK